MSLIGGYRRLNKVLGNTVRRLRDIDDAASALEGRNPLGRGEIEVTLVGPDGKPVGGGTGGGAGANFLAGSVAPVGTTGTGIDMKGKSQKIGSGGESGQPGQPGVVGAETNRDKIGAIIEAAGVAPPPEESWDENGTGPGEFPGLIFRTVLSLGTNAPQRFLVWCAGWLVYSSAATTKLASATASRHGGGFNGNPMSGKRDPRWGDFNFAGPARIPWVDRAAGWGSPGYVGPSRPGYTGQVQGGQTSQGITNSQARSIAQSTQSTAQATNSVVSAVKELTSVVKNGQNSVGSRAAGYL